MSPPVAATGLGADLMQHLRAGATVTVAAARTGVAPDVAAVIVEHYRRLGLVQVPGCERCPAARRGSAPIPDLPAGCAGCPLARR